MTRKSKDDISIDAGLAKLQRICDYLLDTEGITSEAFDTYDALDIIEDCWKAGEPGAHSG